MGKRREEKMPFCHLEILRCINTRREPHIECDDTPTSLSCNTNNKKTKNSNNNDRLIFFPTPLKLNRTKSLNNTSIDSSFYFNAQESEIKLAKPIFSAQENGIKTIYNDKHSNNTVASSEKKIKSSSSSLST